ncbi:hypothetical protein GQS78_05580 [Thermococcus bergensis]|uniref:hypothetical protein n=1 Tax=Thermococcus bergensis TaxID=2689387 RepID=UPI001CECD7CD|nr:hypothetical protein [Thermococcus bergensis]MCA6213728.1 hypothetical protein [Thermococcus bergensis]
MGFKALKEFSTKDNARIDLAVLRGDEEILAIEFENSYKWIKQRILYNGIKAHRAGFKHLWVVYPFRNDPLRKSWVEEYLKELGVEVEIVSPEGIGKKFREFLSLI